jgi:lipoate-protein ligase A
LSAFFISGEQLVSRQWRLILDSEPASGSWNMAVDDFLYQSLEKEPVTTLRFYSWAQPTVSLGYSQNPGRVLDTDYCRKNGIEVVRRITGGKLVLHDREVTYALCSNDSRTFSGTVSESYRRISEGLMLGLANMGLKPRLADSPPSDYARSDLPCFSYPARDEVEVLGQKIVGSAQKREGDRFLQHGSIPLHEENERLRHIAHLERSGEQIRMISLSRALGRDVDFLWAAEGLAGGLAEFFGVSLVPFTLSSDQLEGVRRLERGRHRNPDWIEGRLRT